MARLLTLRSCGITAIASGLMPSCGLPHYVAAVKEFERCGLSGGFSHTLSVLCQVTTLMSAIDEVESQPQLSDEEFAALQERVKEQGAVVKASKEARTRS